MQLINSQKFYLVSIFILLIFFIMNATFAITQVQACNFKNNNSNMFGSKFTISLQNNLLPIYELNGIDFSNNSVIPVLDADYMPLLNEDFFYKKNVEHTVDYSYENWKLNYFNKSQADLIGSSGLIKLINYLKDDISSDRNLDIGFLRNKTEYEGQKVTYNTSLQLDSNDELEFGITMKYLQGTNYYRERFTGIAVSTDNQGLVAHDFDYNLYGETEIYKVVDSSNISSSRYGLDIMTKYMFCPRSYIQLQIDDLLGKINWNHIKYETSQISTNTTTRDAEGNINYTATMKGTEKYIDIEQNLPRKVKLTLNLYANNIIWQPQLSWEEWKENNKENRNYVKPYLDIIYPFNMKHKYYLGVDFKAKTIETGFKYNNFNLKIFSDHINPKKVQAVGGAFSLNLKF